MKKILLALSLVALSAVAFAAPGDPGTGVLASVHDMRTATGSGPGSDFGGNDRVCAFCHTPHHAYQGSDPNEYYPLWSRTLDGENFAPYASSTINAIDWASDVAIGPTRLCMSCHDGTIAVDQHYGSNRQCRHKAERSECAALTVSGLAAPRLACWLTAASPTIIRSASTTTP